MGGRLLKWLSLKGVDARAYERHMQGEPMPGQLVRDGMLLARSFALEVKSPAEHDIVVKREPLFRGVKHE